MNFDGYLKYSIILFIVISVIIWIKKPKCIFDNDNNLKKFGIGNNKTIFYFPFVLIVLAIIIYFIFFSFYLRKSLR